MAYNLGYKLIREFLNENCHWYKFSDVGTLKSHSQGQKVKFKVNFQKCLEWPENSSESFWKCKYANVALDLGPITLIDYVRPNITFSDTTYWTLHTMFTSCKSGLDVHSISYLLDIIHAR